MLSRTPDIVSSVKKPKNKKKRAENSSLKNIIRPALIIIASIAADQISKIWAVKNLAFNQPVEIIGSFFRFTLVYNEGGAMGTNFGSSSYYLISSILILLFILYYIYANKHITALAVPLAFIAGGAVGNIVDRIRYGHVIDFIDVDFFDIDLFGYQLQRWCFQ